MISVPLLPSSQIVTWLGNPLKIPRNSVIILIPDLFNSRIVIRIFSDHKICSRQFVTRSCRFRILSRHWFFRFHELENVTAIFVSGEGHQILRLNAPTLFACTIAITLFTISTQYTQIYENLIDVSRYPYCCWSTNTGKNGFWWWRSHLFSFRLQLGIRVRSTPCSWFRLGLSGHYPWHFLRWWW